MRKGLLLTWSATVLLTSITTLSAAEMPTTVQLEQVANRAYEKFKDDTGGKNADYIKALAKVPSELFGIAIVTRAGDVITVGDVDYPFSIQSCSKVFSMCLVMQESGDETVLEKVNVEPTGEAFNSIRAIEEGDGRADNPFVNAGAIATVSLIEASSAEERWQKIIDYYSDFAGEELTVLQDIYESEAADNFRNRGIAHILYNSKNLHCEPLEATDVYTMQCSVGVTAKQLAVMGSVLANGGVNPITGERCLDAEYIPKVLAMMTMAGFYDGAGVWAWNAGLPAKTGVGGGIVAVVPGKMAIVGFAPPLDSFGNSVRAQKAIEYISDELDLNIFGTGK
ncbi:glutaminase A [Coraliomargarita akajimensis]|uniref:Glutaminase n=1 Tax=Coraliomargarita akajimensis (strain DSM 45221 / IAM 15411 / JCM 23193 / KCTC 12865 / 04OKA010-24) TaxID=583355 RepID=D5ERF8_CORAD|nr:glutaminase A [Coraliomargarita akajimensis]ADE56002.1 Glutaminase [Coraliomargarita akajimensis DSM 45221]